MRLTKEHPEWQRIEKILMARNRELKENRITEYYKNPLLCRGCKKPIPYEKKILRNKFCGRSCAAKINNNIRIRKISPLRTTQRKPCLFCNSSIRIKCNFCNRRCRYEYWIRNWKLGIESGVKCVDQTHQYIKRYMIEKYGNMCQSCGWNKINPVTKRIPIQLDHIDGNWKNNDENNLRLLCPNCHSLTPNYGSLNNGRGRPFRTEWRKSNGATCGNRTRLS